MTLNRSSVFSIILVVIMLGVLFGVLTDSRNSILVKEIVYVGGSALTSILALVFLLMKKPCSFRRIPLIPLALISALILFSVFRFFTGIQSVNGPFTIFMLLSLTMMVVSTVPFLDEKGLRFFIGALLLSSAVVFVYSILQWQGVNIFQWDAGLTRSGRSTGSLGNPNLLGGYASAIVPLGLVWFLTLKGRTPVIKRLLAGIFTTLSVFAIISSGTRGSLIGLAAGSVFLLGWYLKTMKPGSGKTFAVVAVFVLIAAGVTLPMMSRLTELDPSAEDQGTLQVRQVIWSGALAVFRDSPIGGHGPGSFQILLPEHRNPDYSLLGVSHNTLHAHCEYLEILVDLGLVGLLLWGLLVFFTARSLKGLTPLSASALAGIIAMLAEAFVSVHLRWPPTAWLFAVMVLILLAGKEKPEKPGKFALPAAIVLLAGALVLLYGLFFHYIPSARASELVFLGKDMYLNRTEAALNDAYSAASHWSATGDEPALNAAVNAWSYASSCADSAVYCSSEATRIYPYDLGGWYALGSAHLTRYMVINPQHSSMRSALEYSGFLPECSDQDLQNELLAGMEAYQQLTLMAPNYAEVHNNLALGYSNMGDIEESLEELYYSFRVHGHRRKDYTQQALSLIPLCPGSISGVALIAHDIIASFSDASEQNKSDVRYNDLRSSISWMYHQQPDNVDSLALLFQEMIDLETTGETHEDLTAILNSSYSRHPFDFWYSGELSELQNNEAMAFLVSKSADLYFKGRIFPGVLPVEREYYTLPAEIFFQSGMTMDSFRDLMEVLRFQVGLDVELDKTFTLSLSQRFCNSVDEDVLQSINQIRTALGGSRVAMREGQNMPWLSGSSLSLVSDSLQSLQSADSLNSIWYEMEMEMNFLLVSSYWWQYNTFASSQNQYLLSRIFLCRDKIMELNPNSWQLKTITLLDHVTGMIRPLAGSETPATVQLLRDDLVSGTPRAGL